MALDRDESDLAGGEEATDQDERQYEQQVEDRVPGPDTTCPLRHPRPDLAAAR